MTSYKQIEANRFNARKSTGPRSKEGKQRSRQNALSHGLTAETVVSSLENAADYQVFEATIFVEFAPRTATCRELTARLASVLWRLRRSTRIETGLLEIQAELRTRNNGRDRRKNLPLPDWYDEMDVGASDKADACHGFASRDESPASTSEVSTELAYCFVQASRLQFNTFETLTRYEASLWRQAAQLIYLLKQRPAD